MGATQCKCECQNRPKQAENQDRAALVDHKKAYNELYAKHEKLLQASSSVQPVQSQISDEAIDSFVKKLLADPKTNIYGFPDVVEGAVYRNVLKTMLHAVAHISDDSSILFLGHKIRITIEPVEANVTEEVTVTAKEDKGKEEFEHLI